MSRTVIMGDPSAPTMTMEARKTTAGWFQKVGPAPWKPMPVGPDNAERQMLQSPGGFAKCVAGANESLNGEVARTWTYVTLIGGSPTPSTIWISVSRGLPLKVQGESVTQTSSYQATPYAKP